MMLFVLVALALSSLNLAAGVESPYCYPPYPSNETTGSPSSTTDGVTATITLSFDSTTSTTLITFDPILPDPTGTGLSPTGTGITFSLTDPDASSSTTSGPPYTNTTILTVVEPTATLPNSTISTTATSSSSDLPSPTACEGETEDVCDGTCTDLATDINNCGACGNACPRGIDRIDQYTCANGVCTRPACDSKCLELRFCGPTGSSCICATTAEGDGLCLDGNEYCDEHDSCLSTEDCGLGEVCVPNTCCSTFFGKCLSTRGCQNTLTQDLSRAVSKVPQNGAGFAGARQHINGAWF